ncbi:DHCW motif cupin fold protein [Kitasatospora sp. NPDC094019]|uniref:DHCW motif cupin fold protein n=1 Tax=Kitasatospora sp. NPDC094019 TaxID=3364091 RepID=UPI0037FF42D5
MDLTGFPFTATDRTQVAEERKSGGSGEVTSRVQRFGEVRARRVDHSPGYVADHWCRKGHVLFVLEGELVTALDDGRVVVTGRGGSYQVADDAEAHRSSAPSGASPLIVDRRPPGASLGASTGASTDVHGRVHRPRPAAVRGGRRRRRASR